MEQGQTTPQNWQNIFQYESLSEIWTLADIFLNLSSFGHEHKITLAHQTTE